MLAIIVAMDNNRLIGDNNTLPWHLPADLEYFKKTTLGSAVVMGRKTFDSIVAMLGKPLPGRRNIVLSRDTHLQLSGCEVMHNIEEINTLDNAFIIGGSTIYNQTIDMVDTLFITKVEGEFTGDAYFPIVDSSWQLKSSEKHLKDNTNPYDYAFNIYTKNPHTC
jgi:dihydrofolate reductase